VVTGSDFSDHLMRAKLTPAFVIKAATDLERVILWDEAMPGFGLMVTRNGTSPTWSITGPLAASAACT
jgi:hypothetical protein